MPTTNPWRRIVLSLYVRGLQTWFRTGKVPLSHVASLFLPGRPLARPAAATLEEFAAWWRDHTHWKSDPFNGAFDVFPSLSNAAYQLQVVGTFEDDCDGLAYVAANVITPYVDTPSAVYVVTIITDPYSWPTQGLQMAAHVICVFRHLNKWRMVSNSDVFTDEWDDFDLALRENPYAHGHPVLFYEVRTPQLQFVRSMRFSEA